MASGKTLLDEKRDEILRLVALHGAANVRVFGLPGRGADVGRPSPDIKDNVLADARVL